MHPELFTLLLYFVIAVAALGLFSKVWEALNAFIRACNHFVKRSA